MNSEEYGLEPGEEVAGLEPLGPYKAGRGMSGTMRLVFDVLYEADEPLSPEAIAARTYERASGASRFHARRAIIRQQARSRVRMNQNIYRDRASAAIDISPSEAWPRWIKRLLRDARLRNVLVRDEHGRYAPNPEKAPEAARVDGSRYRYTRQAWLETTQQERTIGEVHTMTMEVQRLLGSRSRDELLSILDVLVDELAGFGKDKPRPLSPRAVKSQLRWLLERPTTDESRAWLLHELTRRIYGA